MDIGTDTRDRVIRMEQELKEVKSDIAEIKKSVNTLTEIFHQAKGARALIVTVTAVASTLSAGIATALSYFTFIPK